MNRLSPRTTVLSGATIGLIAGAAIYGAVSSSATTNAPTVLKADKATVATAPVSAARCAVGQLEKGVCIVHVERTVVVPAASGSDSSLSAAPSTSGDSAVEPSDLAAAETKAESEAAEPADDAAEHAAEPADDAAQHALDAAEHAAEIDH